MEYLDDAFSIFQNEHQSMGFFGSSILNTVTLNSHMKESQIVHHLCIS